MKRLLGGSYLLGYNLATGQRIPKQLAEVFRYTRQAAEQGYVPAEAALGMMYADGKGVQQNYAEAGTRWNKAAEGGHVLAASNLSMLYKGGSGVPANADAVEEVGAVRRRPEFECRSLSRHFLVVPLVVGEVSAPQ
jgi:TPR repeat protein